MAILCLSFLKSLSFHGAETLLLQEGYTAEKRIEVGDEIFDAKFIYPYCLYDDMGQLLDCIYYIEYCNQIMDDEYIDGRMTWEDIKQNGGESSSYCSVYYRLIFAFLDRYADTPSCQFSIDCGLHELS